MSESCSKEEQKWEEAFARNGGTSKKSFLKAGGQGAFLYPPPSHLLYRGGGLTQGASFPLASSSLWKRQASTHWKSPCSDPADLENDELPAQLQEGR